jgi:hypothetical protein
MITDKIKIINKIGTDMLEAGLYHNFASLNTNYKDFGKYDCTPLNTILFADSGGDGVHYSYLPIDEYTNPIVMTVPTNFGRTMESYNLILAEDLDEFLSLGYYYGWGLFDGLYYHKELTLKELSVDGNHKFANENECIFLEKIISHFNLKPLMIDDDRLKYLKDTYFEKLEFNEEFVKSISK